MRINDKYDQVMIVRGLPLWLQIIASKHLKNLLRSFVNRARERSFIDSWSYHELHAMIDRVFEPSI
jgi:hypothetical protein